MANTTESAAAVIFATSVSLAAAIARARAGDRQVAKILLERFCDHGQREIPVELDLLAYIGDCLWGGTRQFVEVRDQASKKSRGVDFSWSKPFNLQARDRGRPVRVSPRDPTLPAVPVFPPPSSRPRSRHPDDLASDRVRWTSETRARLHRVSAQSGDYADALAVIYFFCESAITRASIDLLFVRHIATALGPILSQSREDTSVLLGLKHPNGGRPAMMQSSTAPGWPTEVREAAWRFAFEELIKGHKPKDIVTSMVGSQDDHDFERVDVLSQQLFAAISWTAEPNAKGEFVAGMETSPVSRATAGEAVRLAKKIRKAVASLGATDLAAALVLNADRDAAIPPASLQTIAAGMSAVRAIRETYGISLAEIAELHERIQGGTRATAAISTAVPIASFFGDRLDKSRDYGTIHGAKNETKGQSRSSNQKPVFEQDGRYFDSQGHLIIATVTTAARGPRRA